MKTFLPLILAAAAASPALGQAPAFDPDRQVTIPFADQRHSILDFEAPSDHLLFLQDRQRRWYRAEVAGPCFDLKWAFAIGYDTRGSLSLGRGDHIIVGRERCMIVSLTRSEGPPRKAKKKR